MKTAILGITGYTGLVLARLLAEHPEVNEIIGVSSSRAGDTLLSVDSGLHPRVAQKMRATGGTLIPVSDLPSHAPEVVFSALPHLESARVCADFAGKSIVIDFSADFRLHDHAVFERYYGEKIPRADLLDGAAYGLCEWYAEEIREADIIANPGCYPTATLLPLLPLARRNLIRGTAIVNAASGISGAGRKPKDTSLYCERSENYVAYSAGRGHRHYPEMAEYLRAASTDVDLLFTPHLVAMKRGIGVTTAVAVADGVGEEEIHRALEESYGRASFIRLVGSTIPSTSDVWGSNRCDIGHQIEGSYLLLFSAIDNLMKGASGQAVQNMNLRLGLDETTGLPVHGVL